MKTNIFIDISPPIPYLSNSDSQVEGQNAVGQSARFFKM